MTKVKYNWYKIYFFIACVILVFAYGVAVGNYQIFPYNILKSAKDAALDWKKNYRHYSEIRPEKYLYKARHEGAGVTYYNPEASYAGVTMITSMWNHTNGVNLIDMDGSVIHEWRVSLNEIWTEAPQLKQQLGDWDAQIHGAILYPNGDIIFNLERVGLIKIDMCSNMVWKLPFRTHHSIHEDKYGYLWVPGLITLDSPVNRLPLLEPPIHEEFILKISPSGEIIEKLSILDVFYKSGKEGLLFINGKPGTRTSGDNITHINDIEILDESIADRFPLFEAGDIMVSMRRLHLIVIIDSSTGLIKWSMSEPYIRQHDPDFLANGDISVFDNRADDTDAGTILGGSRILSIDPVTREVDILYAGDNQNSFYTKLGGKHQFLPNGNILMTEYDGGRAFEVTSNGQVVWSYINRYDEDEVYMISQASRYTKDYKKFAVGKEQCQ